MAAFVIRLAGIGYGQTYRISAAHDHWEFGGEIGRIAKSVAQGQGFSSPYRSPTGPTAEQPPVLPYVLAGAFKLFGIYTPKAAIAILSLDSLFSALTCAFAFLIGREIFDGRVGVLAAWAWALWPLAISAAIRLIWAENLSSLLLAAIIWITLCLQNSRRISRWAGLGALWGAGALTTPALLSVAPFLLGWLCYQRQKAGLQWHRPLAAALLASVVVVLPWLVRNDVVFGRPVIFKDNFGTVLNLGNNPAVHGVNPARVDPVKDNAEWRQFQQLGELRYASEKRREATKFIERHPGSFLWRCAQRLAAFWVWAWDYHPLRRVLGPYGTAALYFALPALAAAGLILSLKRKVARAWPFAFVFCVFPLVYFVAWMEPRYRLPIEPEMMIFAVYAVVAAARAVLGAAPVPRVAPGGG